MNLHHIEDKPKIEVVNFGHKLLFGLDIFDQMHEGIEELFAILTTIHLLFKFKSVESEISINN